MPQARHLMTVLLAGADAAASCLRSGSADSLSLELFPLARKGGVSLRKAAIRIRKRERMLIDRGHSSTVVPPTTRNAHLTALHGVLTAAGCTGPKRIRLPYESNPSASVESGHHSTVYRSPIPRAEDVRLQCSGDAHCPRSTVQSLRTARCRQRAEGSDEVNQPHFSAPPLKLLTGRAEA